MKNYWVQTDADVVTWWTSFGALSGDANRILSLLDEFVRAGAEEEVFILDREAVQESLRQGLEHHQTIDLRLEGSNAAAARVSWFDDNGKTVEGVVRDLGLLREGLSPGAGMVDRTYRRRGKAPVRVFGPKVRFDRAGLVGRETGLGIALASDIWFPFITAFPHRDWDGASYVDNRDLAERHTPRLNRFLSRVNMVVIAAGGTWELERDANNQLLTPWIGTRGIRLDGPVPRLTALEPGAWDAE